MLPLPLFSATLSHSSGMPELPICGQWTVEEVLLLQEVANYWIIGSMDYGYVKENIMHWENVAEYMNQESKKYFISNRVFTIEECVDRYRNHWSDPSAESLVPVTRWTTKEIELFREASVTCPQRKEFGKGTRLVPDFEAIKLFMNIEAIRRGIRRRYYTYGSLQSVYFRHCRNVSRARDRAPKDTLKQQEAKNPNLQIVGAHEPPHSPNEDD